MSAMNKRTWIKAVRGGATKRRDQVEFSLWVVLGAIFIGSLFCLGLGCYAAWLGVTP